MAALTLNLKREYFEAIRDGRKMFEYRERNDYWRKRLENRQYDTVAFCLGCPKKDEFAFRWNHRKSTDGERTESLIRGVEGKRLQYKHLIKKEKKDSE